MRNAPMTPVIVFWIVWVSLCCTDTTEAWTSPRRGGQQQQSQGGGKGSSTSSWSPPRATLAPQHFGGTFPRLRLPSGRWLPSTSLVGSEQQLIRVNDDEMTTSSSLDASDRWIQAEIESSLQQSKSRITSSHRRLSVAQVFQIAIPAVAVGLCWPILSMQDTSAVGRAAGTVAQAALHPAIAVLNYASKLLIFLYSGTATMVSSSRSNSNDDVLPDDSIRVVDTALQVAFGVGCLVMAAVWALSARQPSWMVQHGPATAVYTAIRAAAFPAAAVLATWQTASLGLRRVVGPVLLTLLAVATNAVGNAWCVPRGALRGAAWATVVAQYVAAAAGVLQWQHTKQRQRQQHNQKGTASPTGTLTSSSVARTLAKYFIPISTTQASRAGISVSLDTIIVQAASAPLSAAHQIITSVYYGVICNTGDGLSLAAQTLAPRSKTDQEKKQLYKTMGRVAVGTGCLMSAVMGWSLSANGAFTSDGAVQDLMRLVLPQFLVIGWLQSWFATSEGLLLGRQDLQCVGLSYGAFSVVAPIWLWLSSRGASTAAGLVSRLWTAWLGYAIFRILVLGGRALWLQYGRSQRTAQEKALAGTTKRASPRKGGGLALWKTLRMLAWSEEPMRRPSGHQMTAPKNP